METKKIEKQGEEFKFQGGREGNLKFKDSKIQRFKIQNSRFKIQDLKFKDSSFCILHSAFSI